MRVLVTGAAGFIGFHLSDLLLKEGHEVVGLDSHNDYYDPDLKAAREAKLVAQEGYHSVHGKVETPGLLMELFDTHRPDAVVHLAAQAGVRYSIENPRAYVEANLLGSFELLEAARAYPPKHLLMASTSSVYGANTDMPYRETDKVDTQMSFYAATKKSNEAMAHSYAHLFGVPTTMFRFFTVYGPWGRPDMAPYLFTSAIIEGRPIKVFNHGDMRRDFTYVTDLVRAIRLLIDAPPVRPESADAIEEGDSLSPVAPWRAVNIGNGDSVQLLDFIAAIEAASNRQAVKNLMPMQPGDVPATWADTTLLRRLTGYAPQTSVREGAQAYVDWYRDYYGIGA
ncbi:NAD-dependent epimerase/dehydratase family protein [Paracoccus aurantiacus]|uniref:NAD-dependent epimerase/dehydratase family protein n=1 Tax=Paracoccus aurantiacus TaxID=2599412 RepID=A0A5C6RXS2_9RHOB|nr:NAD-dependent epimerase/dehydratase family protein [Paracoccus aurantiacus]TXB66420.1 NAD-dependent epimerase/dehydratase family protein [Paracoccus aurantiacus]